MKVDISSKLLFELYGMYKSKYHRLKTANEGKYHGPDSRSRNLKYTKWKEAEVAYLELHKLMTDNGLIKINLNNRIIRDKYKKIDENE